MPIPKEERRQIVVRGLTTHMLQRFEEGTLDTFDLKAAVEEFYPHFNPQEGRELWADIRDEMHRQTEPFRGIRKITDRLLELSSALQV